MFILFLGFNTASGKYYCNKSLTRLILELNCKCFNTASGRYYCNFTGFKTIIVIVMALSFNTASGRYYCNVRRALIAKRREEVVSILQAVGTIAIVMRATVNKTFC